MEDDAGKVAVMRGPVVFCLEEADNGKNLSELMIGTIESHCENSVILNGYREHTMDSVALYSTNPPSIEESVGKKGLNLKAMTQEKRNAISGLTTQKNEIYNSGISKMH